MEQESELASNTESPEPDVSREDIDRALACAARFDSIVWCGRDLINGSPEWYVLRRPRRYNPLDPKIYIRAYSRQFNEHGGGLWSSILMKSHQPLVVKAVFRRPLTLAKCRTLLPLVANASARRVELDAETATSLRRIVGYTLEPLLADADLTKIIAFTPSDVPGSKDAEAEMARVILETGNAISLPPRKKKLEKKLAEHRFTVHPSALAFMSGNRNCDLLPTLSEANRGKRV